MLHSQGRTWIFILLIFVTSAFSDSLTGFLKVAAIRVEFAVDDAPGTTGDGTFLLTLDTEACGSYTIDPPPHNQAYFISQLNAVDSYYRTVSDSMFGIDIQHSTVYPDEPESTYTLPNIMSWYHPYGVTDEAREESLTQLFRDALTVADTIPYNEYDLVVVFHAGIGQDFSLPTLDPTPEDIPSTYVDREMLGTPINGVEHGMILPETQNHLLFPETESIFSSSEDPCEYQFGLTGTFALMIGFSVGLPPLWNTETGESGIGVFGLMDQGSNNGRGIIPSPPDAWTRKWAGWTSPEVIIPTAEKISLSATHIDDSPIQVNINQDEYFLIENRNNWHKDGVSIDSTRFAIWEETGDYPAFYKILFDSVNIEIEDNGVITSVPSYDIGLPASGLLIWHVDESVINSAPDWYSINADRSRLGIDLEEADGAQDIGYPSIHMFADPSSGYFGDMWFKGNQEYASINGTGEPVFGPYTYPNTQSNDGVSTFTQIENISAPNDTMTFTVSNTLLVNGFPDTTAYFRMVCDINDDGTKEIIGGKDSLWWAPENDVMNRKYFIANNGTFTIDGEAHLTKFSQPGLPTRIYVAVHNDDSSYLYSFEYYEEELNVRIAEEDDPYFDPIWIVNNQYHTQISMLGTVQYQQFQKEAVLHSSTDTLIAIIEEDGGLGIYKPGSHLVAYQDMNFVSIAAIDLNLDGNPDILATDDAGKLYAFDKNLILMPGFPLGEQFNSPIFAFDVVGDNHPEIAVESSSGDRIVILNYFGETLYEIAKFQTEEIQYFGNMTEFSYLATSFNLWKFDEATDPMGNEWSHQNGNPYQSRTLALKYSESVANQSQLLDADRCYAYPNPSRDGLVTLRIQTESAESIEINIYDLAGYYVERFFIEHPAQGMPNEVIWNVSDIESGVYFANVTAKAGEKTQTKIIKIAVIH